MGGNTFGKLFTLTTFGESHGAAIGGIIDGCPPLLQLDFKQIQHEVNRRKPNSFEATTRREDDEVEFLSGIFEGKTTGTPIAFMLRNNRAKSADYAILENAFRPSHADYTYQKKYGIRDYRGGGRASARETVARVIGGAIAKQILQLNNISIQAYVSQIGNIGIEKQYQDIDLNGVDSFDFRFPNKEKTTLVSAFLEQCKNEGNTVGGIITCVIKNCPTGLGEPVFDKLQADLAKAMLSINSAKGFEYGSGFTAATMKGSEHNDIFNPNFSTKTNYSGGIQGGISNGEDIYFNVAFKPIASLKKEMDITDTNGQNHTIKLEGRHDVCAVPRIVPIVEAMCALTLADHLLCYKTIKNI